MHSRHLAYTRIRVHSLKGRLTNPCCAGTNTHIDRFDGKGDQQPIFIIVTQYSRYGFRRTRDQYVKLIDAPIRSGRRLAPGAYKDRTSWETLIGSYRPYDKYSSLHASLVSAAR